MKRNDQALKLLEVISEDASVTQRSLAGRLGIAVGLTNLYLKRLARKGYIKFVNVHPNRIMYLLTPQGIAEKSRLTYEFMDYSLVLYRQVRTHLNTVVQDCVRTSRGVALYGTGEAAELAYLCLREHGLEPLAVFDRQRGQFLGMPVHDIRDHERFEFDLLILARLEPPDGLLVELAELGISEERLIPLRPPAQAQSRSRRKGKSNGHAPARAGERPSRGGDSGE